MFSSPGRDTCRQCLPAPLACRAAPARPHCFRHAAVRPGRPGVCVSRLSGRAGQPRQVDVGHDISGQAWLSPCPVHASQNRKGQSEVGNRGLKCQFRALAPKALIILVKISRQTTPPKPNFHFHSEAIMLSPIFSSPSGPHRWIIGGTEQMGGSSFSFTCLSDPVLPVLKF